MTHILHENQVLQAIEKQIKQHTCDYRVIYGDTDQMGVVYHANYLRFFERGRCEFMRHFGFSYIEFEQQGLMVPVVEAQCQYRRSAKFDDLLLIETTLGEIKNASFTFLYRITRDGILLTEGKTVHACIDRAGKAQRLPAHLRASLLSA